MVVQRLNATVPRPLRQREKRGRRQATKTQVHLSRPLAVNVPQKQPVTVRFRPNPPRKLPASPLGFATLFASKARRLSSQAKNSRIICGDIEEVKVTQNLETQSSANSSSQPVVATTAKDSLLPLIDAVLPQGSSKKKKSARGSQQQTSSKNRRNPLKGGSSRSRAIELDTPAPSVCGSQIGTIAGLPSWSPAFRKILDFNGMVREDHYEGDDEAAKAHGGRRKRHHHQARQRGKQQRQSTRWRDG